jgi:hypothetical protein
MLKVIERKTQKEGLAWQLDEGRYAVDLGEGNVREIANSTFRRLFTVIGEASENEVNRVEQQTEQQEEQQPEQVEQVANEELESLLADSEEVIVEETPSQESVNDTDESAVAESKKDKKEKTEKPKGKTVQDLGLSIRLLDWHMTGTRGGKTDKVTSLIEINDYLMEITEYAGYITDVRLFKENPEASDTDPESQRVEVYRSPKMSLKDTLEWLGLNEEDMKVARKEITSIRRQVKAAHLEQLEEQKEFAEMSNQ